MDTRVGFVDMIIDYVYDNVDRVRYDFRCTVGVYDTNVEFCLKKIWMNFLFVDLRHKIFNTF